MARETVKHNVGVLKCIFRHLCNICSAALWRGQTWVRAWSFVFVFRLHDGFTRTTWFLNIAQIELLINETCFLIKKKKETICLKKKKLHWTYCSFKTVQIYFKTIKSCCKTCLKYICSSLVPLHSLRLKVFLYNLAIFAIFCRCIYTRCVKYLALGVISAILKWTTFKQVNLLSKLFQACAENLHVLVYETLFLLECRIFPYEII